jgi:hypothetical protein
LALAKDSPLRRILKWINEGQKLPEGEKKIYLDRMNTNKHLSEPAYPEVESEFIEQRID